MTRHKNKKLPLFLKPYLWSVKIDELDPNKDKTYVIHQILAFGNLEALKWLYHFYSLVELKKVFLTQPMRIYRPASFYYISNIFFKIKKPPSAQKYVAAQLPTSR